MEKPVILSDYSHASPPLPNIKKEAEDKGSKKADERGASLRRSSQSEPRLDVPHFVNSHDKGLHTSLLHHVLTGGLASGNESQPQHFALFCHPSSDMPLNPELSSPNQRPSGSSTTAASLGDRNKSALELSFTRTANDNANNTSTEGIHKKELPSGLRKVASISNYDFLKREHPQLQHSSVTDHLSPVVSGPLRTFSAHHLFPTHLGGHHQQQQQQLHHPIGTIPEDQSDQGLMMTMRSNSLMPGNLFGSASTSTLNNPSPGGSAGSLHVDSLTVPSVSAPGMGSSLTGSGDANQQRSASFCSGMMGMFGRGFFAKPVIRSEEENYRYIMALDR